MEASFLNKSKENLKAAQLLLENRYFNASANRSYYAAFHASLAALTQTSLTLDRISHEAVQSNFVSEFIHKRKVYPNHIKAYLADLQVVRNDADYKIESLSEKIALRQLKKAVMDQYRLIW